MHRHIIEELLGRELATCEHVYHKDGDPKNNSIDNLVLVKKNYK